MKKTKSTKSGMTATTEGKRVVIDYDRPTFSGLNRALCSRATRFGGVLEFSCSRFGKNPWTILGFGFPNAVAAQTFAYDISGKLEPRRKAA